MSPNGFDVFFFPQKHNGIATRGVFHGVSDSTVVDRVALDIHRVVYLLERDSWIRRPQEI